MSAPRSASTIAWLHDAACTVSSECICVASRILFHQRTPRAAGSADPQNARRARQAPQAWDVRCCVADHKTPNQRCQWQTIERIFVCKRVVYPCGLVVCTQVSCGPTSSARLHGCRPARTTASSSCTRCGRRMNCRAGTSYTRTPPKER